MIYFSTGRISETLLPALKNTLTSPRALFAGLPATRHYSHSIVLLTLIVLIGMLLSAPITGFLSLFILPFAWLFMLFSVWAWAAYLAWAVRTFAGQELDTVNAFQLATYASVPLLFSFLPFLGIITTPWNLYLNWVALVARLRVREGTALMIILVPILLLIVSLVLLVALLFTLMPDFQIEHMDRMMQF